MKRRNNNIQKLLASVAVCQLAGFVGSVFTAPAVPAWYAGLAKPWFAPPNWVFAPAWMVLYTLMGVALYLVWKKGYGARTRPAFAAFGVQLALNALWSFLFFGLRSPASGFAGIAALWLAIAYTVFEFRKVSRDAALLMLPYIAWVSFAAALNYYVWILNF